MLLIYTPYTTNRILFTMHYVFEERLGVDYHITDKLEDYAAQNEHLKIAYSPEGCNTGIYFFAESLLFENDIKDFTIQTGNSENAVTLFYHNKKSALNFDVFAAIFYLLSRYEEYLDQPLDKYGNYNCHNSILYKLNILHKPIIEQWIELLKQVLLQYFPGIKFKQHIPKMCLSFDVDVAYAYKNRTAARTFLSLVKNLFSFKELTRQTQTLLNKQEDNFDTYDYIFSVIKNIKPVFFFNMGAYGRFDKNPSFKNKQFRKLIKDISQKATVGIHPSYASNRNKNLIASEKNKLENIVGKRIFKSRQHYLKLKFPKTYNNLLSNNITEDFTIGYSADYGFRAGTCNPFFFFDLLKNQSTQLKLFPFACMEVTLNNYLHLDIHESKKIFSELINTIYCYNGTFISLWHNSTLCNCNEWKNWRDVFEHMLSELNNKDFKNLFE